MPWRRQVASAMGAMELLRDSIPAVSVAVAAAALYARVASSLLRPGLPRLIALLPLFPLLAAAPLAFASSTIVRGVAAFFLAWLGAFKVALLAAGRGPLDPAMPVLPFLFTAMLPVKLRGAAAAPTKASNPVSLVSCAVKVAAIAALVSLYRFNSRLHLYARLTLYGVHTYCFLDLLLPCIAAATGAVRMETEPQFDRPYLASSLRDFWGRRWNLMVSAILRPSVYDPVRARAGGPAGVLASFAVSGLMHEAIVCYLSLRWPPGGGMAAFFALHGACCVAEGWCARRWAARPPRAVATAIVVVFVAGTSFWLFFPALLKDGVEERFLEEWVAVAAFFQDAGGKIPLLYGLRSTTVADRKRTNGGQQTGTLAAGRACLWPRRAVGRAGPWLATPHRRVPVPVVMVAWQRPGRPRRRPRPDRSLMGRPPTALPCHGPARPRSLRCRPAAASPGLAGRLRHRPASLPPRPTVLAPATAARSRAQPRPRRPPTAPPDNSLDLPHVARIRGNGRSGVCADITHLSRSFFRSGTSY